MARRPATLALALFAAVIALGAGAKLIPALLDDTTATSSTPVRRELAGDYVFALASMQRACLDAVPFDRDSAVAQIGVRRVRSPGAALAVTATAPGYRAAARIRLAPHATRVYRPEVSIPLTPPEGSVVGSLCLQNAGPGAVELIGTTDPRALTRTAASLDGVPQRAAFSVRLLDDEQRSLLARTPDFVARAAALSPFGPWLFWALIPLVALGMPLLVGNALRLALRDPDDPPTRRDVA